MAQDGSKVAWICWLVGRWRRKGCGGGGGKSGEVGKEGVGKWRRKEWDRVGSIGRKDQNWQKKSEGVKDEEKGR